MQQTAPESLIASAPASARHRSALLPRVACVAIALAGCSVTYDVGDLAGAGGAGGAPQTGSLPARPAGSPADGTAGKDGTGDRPPEPEPVEDTADRCSRWSQGVPLGGDPGTPASHPLFHIGVALWSYGGTPEVTQVAGRAFLDRYRERARTTGDLYCVVLDALRDARAQNGLRHFFDRWLGTSAPLTTEPRLFATDTPERLRALAQDAVTMSMRTALLDQARVADLFAGDRESELVAQGEMPAGDWLARMRGGGLLSEPWVMAISSTRLGGPWPDPASRGAELRARFLCEAVPAPPADLPTVEADTGSGKSYAEQYAAATLEVAQCGGCHRVMTGLGLALDPFDVAGRLHPRDRLGVPFRGDRAFVFEGARVGDALSAGRALGSHPALAHCFARTYASFLLLTLRDPGDRAPLPVHDPGLAFASGGIGQETRIANLVAHAVVALAEKGLIP